MNKKQSLSAFASLLLAGGILAGCNSEGTEAEPKPAEEQEEVVQEETETTETEQTTEVVSVEDTATGAQVAAYKTMMDELVKAKEDQPVDWELVASEYQTNLQSAIAEINGDFDQAISAAIEAGKSEQIDPKVAIQLVDKTTQSYFYQKQKSLHSDIAAAMEAGNDSEANIGFEELKYLAAEVFIPTAVKRDSYYELTGEASMEQNINAGLAAQEEALQAGNADDFSVFKQLTDKTIYRSYYLAAQSYGEKIEKAVAEGETDPVVLGIKQAEAWGFYQAIKGSLSGGNEEAANKLEELFSLDQTEPSAIKGAEVKDLFAKAFVGKIKSYHEKAPADLAEGDLTKARAHALEGNVFMKGIELVMIEKLGQEKTEEAFTHATQWYDAIAAENVEEAATHSAAVVPFLDELVK